MITRSRSIQFTSFALFFLTGIAINRSGLPLKAQIILLIVVTLFSVALNVVLALIQHSRKVLH